MDGARRAAASEVFSITMTKTCGFAALGEGVDTWISCVGSAGAGPILGIAFGGASDCDVAAGEAHATTSATTVVRRRARTRSTLSHRDVHTKPFASAEGQASKTTS